MMEPNCLYQVTRATPAVRQTDGPPLRVNNRERVQRRPYAKKDCEEEKGTELRGSKLGGDLLV